MQGTHGRSLVRRAYVPRDSVQPKKKREREKKDGPMERDFLFMGVRLKTTKDERVLFYLV